MIVTEDTEILQLLVRPTRTPPQSSALSHRFTLDAIRHQAKAPPTVSTAISERSSTTNGANISKSCIHKVIHNRCSASHAPFGLNNTLELRMLHYYRRVAGHISYGEKNYRPLTTIRAELKRITVSIKLIWYSCQTNKLPRSRNCVSSRLGLPNVFVAEISWRCPI